MPDVTLYQFPPTNELPSFSPFCWKVQMALRARGVPFEAVSVVLAKRVNPQGKLPYVRWDGEGLEDSSAIVRVIDERAGGDGPRLVPDDAALAGEAHILEDWADESLYFHGAYAKFADSDGWASTRPYFVASMPPALRLIAPIVARRDLLRRLSYQGMLRRAPALVAAELGGTSTRSSRGSRTGGATSWASRSRSQTSR